jgi:hypothetical protein
LRNNNPFHPGPPRGPTARATRKAGNRRPFLKARTTLVMYWLFYFYLVLVIWHWAAI